MRKILYISAITLILSSIDATAALNFSGNTMKVLTEKPDASTGLNDLYILNATGGVSATYTAKSSASQVKWYRYSALGGGYADEISGIEHNGNKWTLRNVQGDMGYIVEEGTDRYYCWIVDYSQHRFSVSGLNPYSEQECDIAAIVPSGYGDKIVYFTINGRPVELDRGITLTYNTLEFDQEQFCYNQTSTEVTYPYLQQVIHCPSPLCETRFTLSGDKFLKQWNQGVSVESQWFTPKGVDAETTAIQTPRTHDNEQKDGGDDALGGSAPAEIEFKAAITDAVVFKEWQISKDPEFNLIDMRINDLVTTYTFTEQGTSFVRFVAANNAGDCESVGTVYEVTIGASSLVCPNAFSPGVSEGVNDEWKVSYKSIIDFECHIFNKWGTKMATLSDPSEGWDGRYNGKLVPAGVYYYVIKATGSDGKQYKLSGDINIVNYR